MYTNISFLALLGLRRTALRSNFSHSNQICDCNYTHQLANDLLIKTVGNCQPNVAEKLTLTIGNGGPTR